MGKMTIGQKAERVLHFIVGLRISHVLQVMAAHGFKPQDLDEGWTLLRAATAGKLSANSPPPPDPSVLLRLDAWENRWFPIAVASLRIRFPAVYENLFRNLTQTEGAEVIISVGTFLSRLDELKSTPDGKAAVELLASRGINTTVISEAKAMLAQLQPQDFVFPAPTFTDEGNQQREDALWNWYREWGGIARAVITDRRELKSLGFLDDSGHAVVDDSVLVENTPPVVPVATNTTTPATHVDDPGMPGASPFVRQ